MKAIELTIKGVKYPFYTKDFIDIWALWLQYRKEIKKPICSKVSQQAALYKLAKLSENNEETAIAIIQQSLENNWRGLFELKANKLTYESNRKNTDEDLIKAIRRRYEN